MCMQKALSGIFLCALFLTISGTQAEAKILPQALGKSSFAPKAVVSSTVIVSPRLRADRKALNVTFSGLTNAISVSYTLTYSQNGQQEGAGGSLTLDKAA